MNAASWRSRPYKPAAHPTGLCAASPRLVCRRRRGWRSLANRRLPSRAPQNPVSSPECRSRGIQNVSAQGVGQDVEGRGLERFHGRKWHQLHTHCSILCCAIQRLQRLQTGKLNSRVLFFLCFQASELLFVDLRGEARCAYERDWMRPVGRSHGLRTVVGMVRGGVGQDWQSSTRALEAGKVHRPQRLTCASSSRANQAHRLALTNDYSAEVLPVSLP